MLLASRDSPLRTTFLRCYRIPANHFPWSQRQMPGPFTHSSRPADADAIPDAGEHRSDSHVGNPPARLSSRGRRADVPSPSARAPATYPSESTGAPPPVRIERELLTDAHLHASRTPTSLLDPPHERALARGWDAYTFRSTCSAVSPPCIACIYTIRHRVGTVSRGRSVLGLRIRCRRARARVHARGESGPRCAAYRSAGDDTGACRWTASSAARRLGWRQQHASGTLRHCRPTVSMLCWSTARTAG